MPGVQINWENLSHASAFVVGLVLGATFTVLVMRIVVRVWRDESRDATKPPDP